MHILYLHQHFSGPEGTTATRSWAMARALAAEGHRVTMACGRFAGAQTGLEGPFRQGLRRGKVGLIEVVEFAIPYRNAMGIAARGTAFLRFAAAAGRLALDQKPDLIIASSTPLTVALPALAARRLAGIPFVFEIRDPWPELPRAMGGVPAPVLAGMEWLANAACRRAPAVIALSEGMAGTALDRGAAIDRVFTIPNGCDLDLFGPQITPWRPPEAQSWEAVAIYAGAHGRANGLDTLLDAAAILCDRGEAKLRLLLVGEGSEKARLMRRASEEGLGNVSFLDPLPKRRLGQLLAGSQIGLHCIAPVPEFAEWTAPNKLMDYLAAGLPVVSNLPGRAARLLRDGPCGVLVAPDDPRDLADALARLAADPRRRAQLGEAARRQAVRRWDRRLLARDFVEVVEAAVDPATALRLVPA